jgi:hypothetical protein
MTIGQIPYSCIPCFAGDAATRVAHEQQSRRHKQSDRGGTVDIMHSTSLQTGSFCDEQMAFSSDMSCAKPSHRFQYRGACDGRQGLFANARIPTHDSIIPGICGPERGRRSLVDVFRFVVFRIVRAVCMCGAPDDCAAS